MKRKLMSLLAASAAMLISFSACQKSSNGDDLIDDGNGGGEETLHASLKGTNYFPIVMDATTFEQIKSKVAADLRPDEVNKFLYVWDGTYLGGTTAGLSFYGLTEGWTCLQVQNVGWSGAGYLVKPAIDGFAKFADIAREPQNYYLHIAYKGAAGVAQRLALVWGEANEYNFAIGEGKFVDNGNEFTAIAPKSGKFVANDWNEYEINIKDTEVNFSKTIAEGGTNIFTMLSGGVAGTEINLDAVFIYKK